MDVYRPVMQGDIFEDVLIPGVGIEHSAIMVVAHPCSMRHKAVLRDRIQAIPVTQYAALPLEEWPGGHFKVFPLPDLDLDVPAGHFAARFEETGMVARTSLDATTRVACLSEHGVLLLQQRYAHHLTRAVIDLPTLRQSCVHILEEAELQEEWCAALVPLHERTIEDSPALLLDAESIEFDRFLIAIEGRKRLLVDHERAAVRRAVQAEIKLRSEERRLSPERP